MRFVIYFLICMLHGYTCAKASITLKDWEYWALLTCVVGAFLCGSFVCYQ